MIKINGKIHGFKLIREYPVSELSATLFEFEYEKNGAKLYFLDRKDENKTFAISFKTVPEDDTGVFHIIEHSVLCGSEKYPVKEPFVELLKGSLNTFLNAMTFPDKTVYPISTRNDKDYLNLINVYLDAVFNPAFLKNENIFAQEGWHYEFNESGELFTKGVVYNEMKGAYSSPDTVASQEIMRMLYPDSCYSCESGGTPSAIPILTYKTFTESHGKYYHPSNAHIFLDGSVNLEETLSLIDTYLSKYEKREVDFEIGECGEAGEHFRTVEYEIAPTESENDKGRVVLGFLSTEFYETEKNIALSVVLDALASTNESVLKKKILESALCDEFEIVSEDGIKRQFVTVNFINVKDGREEELLNLFYKTVKEILKDGIDKELLSASINRLEFKMRERDFGTTPRGILFALSVLGMTLYGADPTAELRFDECFSSLRSLVPGDYYEKILRETLIENKSRATLIMTPSKTLGAKREEADRNAHKEYLASLTKEQVESIRNRAKAIDSWQSTEDSPESLATIPALTLEDIPGEIEKIPTRVDRVETTEVLFHDINTEGIVYADMYFDISDISKEEVFALKLYTMLTREVPTEHYDVISLQKKIKANLGALNFSIENVSKENGAKIYLHVSASSLASKTEEMYGLVKEVLLTSRYTDRDVIFKILRQSKISLENYFIEAGHVASIKRAGASVSENSVIDEYSSGYEAYKITKALLDNFDEQADALIDGISKLKDKILNRHRLTVSITGKAEKALAKRFCEMVEYGETVIPVCKIKTFEIKKEGIIIPAQISYSATVSNLALINEKSDGAYHVARSVLSYEFLWNSIRVQGGAYGAGFVYYPRSLSIGFYSYRDPTPARTLACYRQSADFLRSVAKKGTDLTKFIIGAVGDTTPLLTPALAGKTADLRYLSGISHDELVKGRRELLSTDSDKLLEIASSLDKMLADAPVCIIAGKEKLDECDFLDAVLTL